MTIEEAVKVIQEETPVYYADTNEFKAIRVEIQSLLVKKDKTFCDLKTKQVRFPFEIGLDMLFINMGDAIRFLEDNLLKYYNEVRNRLNIENCD